MIQKKLETICQEYYQKYSKEGLKVNLGKLRALATLSAKEAKENYSKLEVPKTCSEEVYIYHWAREALDRNFVLKTLTKVDFKNTPPDPYFKAMAEYFSIFPIELVCSINKKINNIEPSGRLQQWENYSLPIKEIEKRFQKLIIQRKKFLEKNQPLMEIFLRKYKIPKEDYKRFIKNKEKIINFCNQTLPNAKKLPNWFYSELNLPCFVCRVKNFPFDTLDDVLSFVSSKCPVLKQFKEKVKIVVDDKTWTKYDKKKDCFLVKINKDVNFRHRAISLIHELGHVINFLKDFQKGIDPLERGKYVGEKEAFKFELQILGELSEDLLKVIFADVLLIFRREMFEIGLYDNPHQDISKLYALTFNSCFPRASQKRNPFYVLDEGIITAPFFSLPHAIAYAEVIWGLMQDMPPKNDPEELLTKIKIERYLEEIDFDGRLGRGEYFSNKEFRELLIKNLEEYFAGKKDQDFIIELGAIFYPEVMVSTDEDDDSLMTSACMLNDLALNYNAPKTKKGRNKVLLSVLGLLRGEKQPY